MPRYYVNLHDDGGIVACDDVGIDLRDKVELTLHMIAMATELLRNPECQRGIWQMEALCKEGRIVRVLTFELVTGQ